MDIGNLITMTAELRPVAPRCGCVSWPAWPSRVCLAPDRACPDAARMARPGRVGCETWWHVQKTPRDRSPCLAICAHVEIGHCGCGYYAGCTCAAKLDLQPWCRSPASGDVVLQSVLYSRRSRMFDTRSEGVLKTRLLSGGAAGSQSGSGFGWHKPVDRRSIRGPRAYLVNMRDATTEPPRRRIPPSNHACQHHAGSGGHWAG